MYFILYKKCVRKIIIQNKILNNTFLAFSLVLNGEASVYVYMIPHPTITLQEQVTQNVSSAHNQQMMR